MHHSALLACIVSRVRKSRDTDSLLPGRRTHAVCYCSCVMCSNRVSCIAVSPQEDSSSGEQVNIVVFFLKFEAFVACIKQYLNILHTLSERKIYLRLV
jgi:hypothetical protein